MKKVFISFLALFFTVYFAVSVAAIERGNKRKGKYTYRKVYSTCFQRGEVELKKPPLSPDTKTQAQWTEVFENSDFQQFGCQQEWANLAEKDLSDIYTYLHDHASDSPTPAKCK